MRNSSISPQNSDGHRGSTLSEIFSSQQSQAVTSQVDKERQRLQDSSSPTNLNSTSSQQKSGQGNSERRSSSVRIAGNKDSNYYLGNRAMHATSCSVALASTVLGLDIVELWTEDKNEQRLECTYVYATEQLQLIYPGIITGFPNAFAPKEHKVSPRLCELASKSSSKYHWRSIEGFDTATNDALGSRGCSPLHPELRAPMKTEIAFLCEGDFQGLNVYIVGFSLAKIASKPNKLKFLNGLGCAIYVTAFEFDDDDDYDDLNKSWHNNVGRDIDNSDINSKEHAVDRGPSSLPKFYSSNNLAGFMGDHLDSNSNIGSLKKSGGSLPSDQGDTGGMFLRGRTNSSSHFASLSRSNSYNNNNNDYNGSDGRLSLSDRSSTDTLLNQADLVADYVNPSITLEERRTPSSDELTQDSQQLQQQQQQQQQRQQQQHSGKTMDGSAGKTGGVDAISQPPDIMQGVPTWDPVHAFSFPINRIPVDNQVYENMDVRSLADLKKLEVYASNSDIYSATLNKETVIVKMLKASKEKDDSAIAEFETEYGILSRVNHSNIIRLIGFGRLPRHFIVLEHLEGGSLFNILADTQNKSSGVLKQMFFRKPTFSYITLLNKALNLAEVLEYLHSNVHQGATIIHRDIKPDNIGFTKEGCLKLFDFGLCTCVKKRSSDAESYKMSGNTGSLRYMAPEVVLSQPYTEKVDIYSFGILVWEMASDRPMFHNFSREEILQKVVRGGQRPQLETNWPLGFRQLLEACWNADAKKRPKAGELTHKLNMLVDEFVSTSAKKRSSFLPSFV